MKQTIKKINMVDIYIIAILLALVFNSSISIFIKDTSDSEVANKVDLVLRTTLASMIGYILSNNFISNKVREQINIRVDEAKKEKEKCIQLLLVGTVTIVCLATLILARHINLGRALNIDNISIINDVFVACVGFLIGYKSE